MRVGIVGGGISGLSAAYFLAKKGIKDIILFERENLFGGKIRTLRYSASILELGPDSFTNHIRIFNDLLEDIGISEQNLISAKSERVNVLLKGSILSFPPEILSLRLNPSFILKDRNFSLFGKIRLLMEFFIKPFEGDETVEGFILRRFGKEFLLKMAEPIFGGIYSSDIKDLSVKATIPRLKEIEMQFGSFVRYALSVKSKGNFSFQSLKPGMDKIVMNLLKRIKDMGVEVYHGVNVVKVDKLKGKIRVITDNGAFDMDKIIVATPSYASAEMLKGFGLADELLSIPHTSVINVYIISKPFENPFGNGFLVSPRESIRIKGCTVYSHKWPQKVEKDKSVLRVFLDDKGYKENEIKEVVVEDLRKIGLRFEPEEFIIHKWERAFPKYTLGHNERFEKIFEFFKKEGIFLTGSSYNGVGLPSCVYHSHRISQLITANLS